jgi:gliding motility-associated-like protein
VVDSAQFTITVSGKPTAAFTYSPNPPQENVIITFTNNSIGGIRYKWLFGDGDSLVTTSATPVTHSFNETKTYNSCLIVVNQFGCPDTVCQPIVYRVIPLLDVPNAFTPNGDGTNDKVFVRGFGIGKMNWKIYNRWGTLVFQTTNRNEGWDGKYKGTLQPTEVYHFVLDVEFTDGQKFQKKGDITLL